MARETDTMKSIPGLRASRALLAAVLDQVGEAIISIGEDQRITMFNKRAEQLFGYSAEEAVRPRPVRWQVLGVGRNVAQDGRSG
jgi:PAS domain-containing protein